MLDINGGATKILCWEGIVFVIVFWQLFIPGYFYKLWWFLPFHFFKILILVALHHHISCWPMAHIFLITLQSLSNHINLKIHLII